MVVMSLEQYSRLTEDIEKKLDEADKVAESTDERFSHKVVFDHVRGMINGKQEI